jgi:hypothetical protein
VRIIQKTWADHSERLQAQQASRNAEARKIKDNHAVMAKRRQKFEAEMEPDGEHRHPAIGSAFEHRAESQSWARGTVLEDLQPACSASFTLACSDGSFPLEMQVSWAVSKRDAEPPTNLASVRHLIGIPLVTSVASPFVDMSEEELDAVDVDALASRVLRLGNELDQVSCEAAASAVSQTSCLYTAVHSGDS